MNPNTAVFAGFESLAKLATSDIPADVPDDMAGELALGTSNQIKSGEVDAIKASVGAEQLLELEKTQSIEAYHNIEDTPDFFHKYPDACH